MRRYLAMMLAAVLLLSAACSRAPEPESTTDAAALPSDTPDIQPALPETTLTEPQTQTETEPETVPPAEKPSATTTRPPVTTTKPPATSAQLPAETNQTERGSEPFTAQYVRFYRRYVEQFVPAAVVTDSREGMLDAVRAFSDSGTMQDSVLSAADKYTDDWFGTNRLIVALMQEPSGSIRHEVRKVTFAGNGAEVSIDRLRPEICTCDIAHWLIFIELPDTRLHAGDPVSIVLLD